jgi:hypothetical protein
VGLFLLGTNVADKVGVSNDTSRGDLGLFDEENGAGAFDAVCRLAIAPDAVGECCSAPLVAEALHPFVFVWAVEALFEGALVAGIGSGRRKSGYVVLALIVSGCGHDWLLEGLAAVCVVAFSSGCLG